MTERYVCPPEHSHALTGACYQKHRCRCRTCTARAAEHSRQYRARREQEILDSKMPRWLQEFTKLQMIKAERFLNGGEL